MSKSAKAPGEFWDRRYDGDDYVFGQDPNLWMASHESLLTEGMTALVPGDGEGRNGVWLAAERCLACRAWSGGYNR